MSIDRISLKEGDALIEVFGDNWQEAVDSKIFQDWRASLDSRFRLRNIVFQSVDFARHSPDGSKRVIFIKFKADVTSDQGINLPGIVFLRGGAVAVLVILQCEGEEYVVLTQQPRFATGNFAFPEIPAGMLDGSGDLSGTAAREIQEETGIVIKAEDLVDMTEAVYGDRWPGVYPSVGVCEEFIRFFLYRKEVTRGELEAIQGRLAGLRDHGELISLKVVRLIDVMFETPDAKALVALCLYNAMTVTMRDYNFFVERIRRSILRVDTSEG